MDNIILCVKQVPKTTNIGLDPVNHTIIRKGITNILNPFDEYALRAAIECKNKYNLKVAAVTMGPLHAKEVLKYCVCKGVDEAFLINDPKLAGSDTLATSMVLAEFIKKSRYKNVFCGQESIDSSTAHIGPSISELLKLPQVSYVKQILGLEKSKLTVEREIESADLVLTVRLPGVFSFVSYNKRVNGLYKKNKGKIIELNLKSLNIEEKFLGLKGSPTRVVDIEENEEALSYFKIDSSLSARERIKAIIQGGIEKKQNRKLYKGMSKLAVEEIINLVKNYK